MARVYRSPLWPLVAVLVGLYLAHDLGANQAFQQSTSFVAVPTLRVEYIPDPKDIVNLADGTPYVVPAGKLLIVTDWAVTNPAISPTQGPPVKPFIRVDGVDVWGGGFRAFESGSTTWGTTTGGGHLSGSLHSGIRANAGQTVTLYPSDAVSSADTRMFASGYLAATP